MARLVLLLTMMLLKYQHRPQSNCSLSTPPNINTQALRPPQEVISPGAIPRKERASALSAQILNFLRVAVRQRLESGVEILAYVRSVFNKVKPLDLLYDGSEEDGAGGVAHPSVELTVWFIGPKVRVPVKKSSCLSFLREGYHVWWLSQVPVEILQVSITLLGWILSGRTDVRCTGGPVFII